MKNKSYCKFFHVAVASLCGVFAFLSVGTVFPSAKADGTVSYCEDVQYGGTNAIVSATYKVYYDTMEVVEEHSLLSVPSFGNTDSTMPNACAPVAGTNVVGYYDRWYTNLIPDYTPGMISAGIYRYFPDLSKPAVAATIRGLYNAMGTNVAGPGTTESEFLDGMTSYVRDAGYSFSYTSFHQNSETVNLQKLTTAVNQGKVGVIFCSTYNFVYSITHSETDGVTTVAKQNSDVAHVMMVYGYQKIAYYKNGVNFRTDTFLEVCSGYSSSDDGYMQINDYQTIDDALIITIS